MMKKKKIVVVCWFVAWIIALLCWIYSIKAIKDAYHPQIYPVYTVISGCAFLVLALLTKTNSRDLCLIGFHDWVVWKDRDDYPDMKRVCVDCGRIQELVYDFLSPFWDDW